MYRAIARNKRNTFLLMFFFVGICSGLAVWAGVLTESYWVSIGIALFMYTYTAVQYFKAGDIAMLLVGGREVSNAEDHPKLWRVVENLSISEGLPMPRVFVIDDESMNAFAAGRDPKHAVVAATSGLLSQLEKFELEGVMAHEMAHVKNYDIQVKTVIFGLVGAISALAQFCFYFAYGALTSNSHRKSGNGKDSGAALALGLGLLALVIGAILSIVAFVIGPIVIAGISRQREYLADASGAEMTRHPEGLISALVKLELGNMPISKSSRGTSHMYFSNPLRRFFWSALTASHPPTEKRIERLQAVGLGF